jgi:DNA helicase IV
MLIPYNQLSEEQKGVIRRISRESGNLFVEGPPGSGKTLISLYTLVDIIQESNVKPFLIIYNQSLYGYLSSALKELGIQDNLTIVTKDKFFWDKARNEFGIPSPDSKLAYMNKYNYLLDNLLMQNIRKEYDVTIIDEVQDINKKEWELIQKLSKRVLALGDFNQGVYKTDLTKSIVSVNGIFERLTKIFRFHKNIAKIAQIFSRNNEDLENKVSIDSSTVPKLIDVKEELEFNEIGNILKSISAFRQRVGVICPDREILEKLSAYLNENNIGNRYYTENRELRNHDFSSNTPLLISCFSSKGLEFEHVIIFGFNKSNEKIIKLMNEGKLKDVLYVSITRSNKNLYILRNENTVDELKNLKVENPNTDSNLKLEDIF